MKDIIIEKQKELIRKLQDMVDNQQDYDRDYHEIWVELQVLESETEPAKELYEKDIPSECRECGFQNTENCNTCKVINTQYDGC